MSTSIINDLLSKSFTENPIDLSSLFEKRLDTLKITKHQATLAMGLDKKTLDPILNYTSKSVDVFNLIKIAEFLKFTDLNSFVSSYLSLMTPEKIKEFEQVRKACFILSNFNIEVLKSVGFFYKKNDFDSIEQRIVTFFELDNIFDYDKLQNNPSFSRTRRALENNRMLDFWIHSANYMFSKIKNPYPFDRTFLKDLLTQIKPFTQDEEMGLIKVIRALYKAGVTVICQPHISTTQIRGATFIIDDKPCIVITDLSNKYPTIWFALLHEICHVLFDFEKIKKSTIHLSFDETRQAVLLEEKEEVYANKFAQDYFLTDSEIDYITPFINNEFFINEYANNKKIHPSFIYAFYCWRNKDSWKYFQRFLPPSKKMFEQANISLLELGKISDILPLTKNIYEPNLNSIS